MDLYSRLSIRNRQRDGDLSTRHRLDGIKRIQQKVCDHLFDPHRTGHHRNRRLRQIEGRHHTDHLCTGLDKIERRFQRCAEINQAEFDGFLSGETLEVLGGPLHPADHVACLADPRARRGITW